MTREEILGAIARGWCNSVNSHKVMDEALALGIAVEIEKALAQPEQSEPYAWDNCRSEKQCRRWCGNSACVSHPAPPLRELGDKREIIGRFLADKGIYLSRESIDVLMDRLAAAKSKT